MRTVSALALVSAFAAFAAVDGTVTNGTTGKPQAGAVVQLYKLGQAGPEFLTQAKSDEQGRFRIDRDLQAGPHLLMTAWKAVNYNKMIPPGEPSTGLQVTVYETSDKTGAKVAGHTMLLEPAAGQVTVTESFFYSNPGQVTFNDPGNGTLRFVVPKGTAKDSLRVRVTEPGGMPVQREPEETKTAGVYKLDFPIKPGDTEFDVNYTAPLDPSGAFTSRVLYRTNTRFAVPNGVTVSGDGLKQIGTEPNTQASIFETPQEAFRLTLTGTGSLRSSAGGMGADSGQGGGDDSGPSIQAIPPPTFEPQKLKILAAALAILALGFVLLYRRGAAHTAGSKPRR